MRFFLLDRIEAVTEDRLVAVKVVSQAEEYLADHFPTFPVLPGVLMLEAAVQAATWLAFWRSRFDFTVGALKSARNIRYGRFVMPGQALRITVNYDKLTAGGHAFKIEGEVEAGGTVAGAITGRIELACFRLSERGTAAGVDEKLAAAHQTRWAELTLSSPSLALSTASSG